MPEWGLGDEFFPLSLLIIQISFWLANFFKQQFWSCFTMYINSNFVRIKEMILVYKK